MSEKLNDGGPAFPRQPVTYEIGGVTVICAPGSPGMSLRQYAAIHLRMPNSGEDWLDDMIREAQRNEFAGQALVGLLSAPASDSIGEQVRGNESWAAELSYGYADAMAERDKRNATTTQAEKTEP